MNSRPQVLLIGNGINISNGGENWKDFLLSIKDESIDVDIDKLQSPMPLQAVLISNNHINAKLKEKRKKLLPTKELSDLSIPWSNILSIGFDEILTTNYTYELEQACFRNEPLSESELKKLAINVSGGKIDRRYLLTTCNETMFQGVPQRIWHIHGEARKRSSMVLGHDYYGRLVKKIIEYLEKKKNSYFWYQINNKELKINSWIDAFIMGDVYVLGQGFNFSEIDLWWLLNRKAAEKADHGEVYFYEPFKALEQEKFMLDVHMVFYQVLL